jgi:hypothetical protein
MLLEENVMQWDVLRIHAKSSRNMKMEGLSPELKWYEVTLLGDF